jgi:hypothetical protein
MRQLPRVAVALAAFLGAIALFGAGSGKGLRVDMPEPTERDAHSISVSIEPEGASSFLLRARVEDAVTGQMLFASVMRLTPGETATMHSPLRDLQLKITATADAASRKAEYTATLLSGFRVLSEHTARVSL